MFWQIVSGMLLLAVIGLCTKIYTLRSAAREIRMAFRNRIAEDSNVLIDISSRDAEMCALAAEINVQLRLLRDERRCHQHGDLELREAIGNASHDLRTPLTAIGGYIALMEREKMSENARRYLAQIQNRADALNRLTEELFRYSAALSMQKLKRERINLVCAVEESLISFYAIMQESAIQPQIDLPDAPVWRELDADALNRILTNVIGNALKYSAGDLRVEMDENGRLDISNAAPDLDTVAVGRLFDRFYTVEVHRNSSGLGLSIAKLLTERMGGKICAQYVEGRLHICIEFYRAQL